MTTWCGLTGPYHLGFTALDCPIEIDWLPLTSPEKEDLETLRPNT